MQDLRELSTKVKISVIEFQGLIFLSFGSWFLFFNF